MLVTFHSTFLIFALVLNLFYVPLRRGGPLENKVWPATKRLSTSFRERANIEIPSAGNGSDAIAGEQRPPLDHQVQRVQERFSSLVPVRDTGDLLPTGAHLETVLKETDTFLQECERKIESGEFPGEEIALLEGQREQLMLVDKELSAIFQNIESKLSEAGLSSKISRLNEFVQYDRGKMTALQAQIEALMQSGKALDNRAAKSQIKPLRSSLVRVLQEEEKPRIFGIGPSTMPPPPAINEFSAYSQRRRAAFSTQNDEPTLADLAESPVVQLTPDIRAQAADLSNSPVEIYKFVRNEFEFEPYFGLMQSSQSALWSGRGNSYDLATLLIALLRAVNIPARYVMGHIRLPVRDVKNWLGVKDSLVALNVLNQTTFAVPSGDLVRLDHAWVEAYVPTGQGSRWVALDPSFKLKDYQPGIQIPKLPFDRFQFISSVKTVLASEAYVDQIREYLRESHPGRALTEISYTGRIIPTETAVLPSALPYEVVRVFLKQSEIDRALHHQVIVSVLRDNFPLVSAQLSIPEVSLKSVTITFGGASSTDQETIELFGGLTNTPAFLVDVAPQIRLDGGVVASGTSALGVGTLVQWRAAYFYPGASQPLFDVSNILRVGETAGIGLNGHQVNDRFLSYRIDRLVSSSPALGTGDEVETVGELLHIAAMRYYQRLAAEKKRVADPLQLKFVLWHAEQATTTSTMDVTNLFDRPFVVTPSGFLIDARGLNVFFVDINSSAMDTPELKNFRQMFGLTLSALEHELWEEVVLIQAVSTTKILQVASDSRIPILVINSNNASTELPKVRCGGFGFQQDIDRGNTIIVPERNVTYINYNGCAWISEAPDGWGVFWITFSGGSSSGGITAGNRDPQCSSCPGPEGDPCPRKGTSVGQPVTVSNGNMYHQFDDLDISSRGFPILLRRTYNSQATYDGPFGYGWTHSYNMSLQPNPNSSVTYFSESGGFFTFARQGNSFISPAGLNVVLTQDQTGYTLREKGGTEFRFDTRGKLQSITDRNGNGQRLTYDQGNLQTITDALGRVITFSYNAQNKIVVVQDFTGRRLTYSYDNTGNLTESVDFGGNKTTYTYYSSTFNNHNLRTITFPEGNTIIYVYYGNDRVFKVINPGGGEMRFVYLPLRQETIVIDERDFVSTYQYNANGNVTRIIRPDGDYIDQVWNNDAKLISLTDEAGFTSSFEYDGRGNVVTP
ncbi:MAG: hypothetical protein HY314_01110 [Acidobacteria bacterium]|nr:hypothetical protein [Acidobacteriota bacterium]